MYSFNWSELFDSACKPDAPYSTQESGDGGDDDFHACKGFLKYDFIFRIDELRDVVSIRRAPPDPAERCASCAKTPGMVATRGRGPERPYVPGSTPALGGAVPLARRS